jgi:hypothetical protein
VPIDPSKPPSISDPEGWQDDSLSRFFALSEYNTRVMFVKYQLQWQLFNDIQNLLDEFVNDFGPLEENEPEVNDVPLFLFMRAHAAYVGALRLVVAVHFVESYPLMRSALENALYAFYFKNHPKAASAWRKRHDGDAAKEDAKKASRIGQMFRHLKSVDEKLWWRANNVYERTIDLGAHPNTWGVVGTLVFDEVTNAVTSNVVGPDDSNFQNSLSYVASTGLVVLELACTTFTEKALELNVIPRVVMLVQRHVAIEAARRREGLIGG